MAEIKISQLAAGNDPAGDEQIPGVQGGITKKFPVGAFKTGLNRIINGAFDFWQRGDTQATSGTGSDDRWCNQHSGSTKVHSQQSLALGELPLTPEARYFSRTAVTSVAGAANYVRKVHAVESVRTLAGKTVTISFDAKADANKNMAVEFSQIFGTGGAPSAAVTGIGVSTVALTAAWQRIKLTVAIPSIAGKVIGTDGNSYLAVSLWFDAGANYAARTNALGQQNGTFDIANVKLEEGPVATSFSRAGGSLGGEEALCQRFYEKGYDPAVAPGTGTTGLAIGSVHCTGTGFAPVTVPFKVTKRATPTAYVWDAYSGNAAGYMSAASPGQGYVRYNATATASQSRLQVIGSGGSPISGNSYQYAFGWAVDAELL